MRRFTEIMGAVVLVIVAFSLAYAGQAYTSWSGGGSFGGDLKVGGYATVNGGVTASGGLINVKQDWIAPAAASTTAYISADTVEPSTSTPIVYSLELASYTMPATSRNIVAQVGGDATSFTGTLTIVGKNTRGHRAVEYINISTTSAAGDIAWSVVDSLTIETSTFTSSGTEVDISIGTGDKLGLINDISAVSDVFKIVEDGAFVAVSGDRINFMHSTFTPATATNGKNNYEVHYKATGR